MTDWQTGLVMQEGETLQGNWKGNVEIEDRVATKGSWGRTKIEEVKTKKEGVLALTNQNLIWLEEKGRFGKSYHMDFAIPLEEVHGISQGGSVHKYITVSVRQASYLFHLNVSFEDFSKITLSWRDGRIKSLRELDEAKRMHFQNVLITCKHCGNRYPQGTLKCMTCGAVL